MEISTCELDAQLLERFSALGTTDKDVLVNQLRAIVGSDISTDSCRFFLELSDWNIQRAIGAYFDFSFENAPNSHTESAVLPVSYSPTLYNLRILPSSIGPSCNFESFRATIENSGCAPWRDGFYVRSEWDPSVASLADRDPINGTVLWMPLGASGRIPLPPVPPGQSIELVVSVTQPPTEFLDKYAKPIVGALSFCSSTDEAFGETLYCTAVPNMESRSWVCQRGIPENTTNTYRDTPMDEA